MSRRLGRAVAILAAAGLLVCGTAYALTGEFPGESGTSIVVSATATLHPRALPDKGVAPVRLSNVTRIKTKDGSQPPVLKQILFRLDKHGTVDTKGLPVCTVAKLSTATPEQARQRCAGALVGEGLGKARVAMPGKAPVTITSPLSFFNGPPSGGRPTLLAHAYETVPAPKALVVPITIERTKHGRYGYLAVVEIPPVAEGFGAPTLAEATLGRTRERGGKTVGYLNAYCAGGRLQVYGKLIFVNGDLFPATLTSPCHTPD
jgi:hypothetical protein